MSNEKKTEEKAKDVELKPLYKETIEEQIKMSEQVVAQLRAELTRVERDLEQNIGVLNHAKFMLQRYALPSKPKDEEKKKTDLEVK